MTNDYNTIQVFIKVTSDCVVFKPRWPSPSDLLERFVIIELNFLNDNSLLLRSLILRTH